MALEVAAWPFPRPHPVIRPDVLPSAHAALRSLAEGPDAGKDVQGRRPAWRPGRLLPAGALLPQRARHSPDMGLRAGGRAAICCRRAAGILDWRLPAVRPVPWLSC